MRLNGNTAKTLADVCVVCAAAFAATAFAGSAYDRLFEDLVAADAVDGLSPHGFAFSEAPCAQETFGDVFHP